MTREMSTLARAPTEPKRAGIDAALARVVAGAATPPERPSAAFEPVEAPDRQPLVAERRRQWAEAAADGDAVAFGAALSAVGVDDLDRALGPVRLRSGVPLPAWAAFLRDALAASPAAPAPASDPPIPFEEALAPFVRTAAGRLAARVGEVRPASFALDLERDLRAALSLLVSYALTHEFGLFRLDRQTMADRFAPSPESRVLYDRFVGHLLAGDWLPLFEAYPALARLVGGACLDWVERAAEVVERTAADRTALEAAFGPLGEATHLWPMASDRHEGGRTVAGVAFASGVRLVYKPRPLGLEAAFYGLLGWLRERDPAFDLRVPRVLDRGSHGWMEFVRPAPCSESGLDRFYRRIGVLLAVAYALNGSDLHMENLVAAGEHPVLVDVETVMTPVPLVEDAQTTPRSVLTTGILPRAGAEEDTSALTGGGARTFEDVPTWCGVNADGMALVAGVASRKALPNRPGPDTEAVDSGALTEGFAAAYRALVRLRGDLLRSPVWAAFRGQRVRYLPRSTATYTTVLMRSLRLDALRSGVDRWIALAVLSRPMADPTETRDLWPLVAAERRALLGGYVPSFTARTDGTALVLGDGLCEGFFDAPGADRAAQGLNALDEADLAVQLRTIRAAVGGAADP